MRSFAAIFNLLVAMLISLNSARSAPIVHDVTGGPGGSAFFLECKSNNIGNPAGYMVGIGVRSGAWIDAIRIICAPLDYQNRRFLGTYTTNYVGGNGGSPVDRQCANNQFVSSIKFGFTRDDNRPKYLDYVQITCQPLADTGNVSTICMDSGGNGCWEKHPNPGPYNGYGLAFETAPCPVRNNVISMGFRIDGRAGAAVDALYMSCYLSGLVPGH